MDLSFRRFYSTIAPHIIPVQFKHTANRSQVPGKRRFFIISIKGISNSGWQTRSCGDYRKLVNKFIAIHKTILSSLLTTSFRKSFLDYQKNPGLTAMVCNYRLIAFPYNLFPAARLYGKRHSIPGILLIQPWCGIKL